MVEVLVVEVVVVEVLVEALEVRVVSVEVRVVSVEVLVVSVEVLVVLVEVPEVLLGSGQVRGSWVQAYLGAASTESIRYVILVCLVYAAAGCLEIALVVGLVLGVRRALVVHLVVLEGLDRPF